MSERGRWKKLISYLKWNLTWGGDPDRLKMLEELARNAETEEDIPFSIRTRPILNQFQKEYWGAYLTLTGSRQFTASGIAEIPYREKIAWLNENEIYDQDERNDYIQLITLLDNAYLEYYYEKNKASTGK